MAATKKQKKRTFRQILKKPSAALEAMCDGLLRFSRLKGFVVDMSTFGRSEGSVCFGCAATCAAQQASGCRFNTEDIWHFWTQSKTAGVDEYDMDDFEMAINSAREGSLGRLFDYFGVEAPSYRPWRGFSMNNNNWRSQIPAVRKLIRELKAAGY